MEGLPLAVWDSMRMYLAVGPMTPLHQLPQIVDITMQLVDKKSFLSTSFQPSLSRHGRQRDHPRYRTRNHIDRRQNEAYGVIAQLDVRSANPNRSSADET